MFNKILAFLRPYWEKVKPGVEKLTKPITPTYVKARDRVGSSSALIAIAFGGLAVLMIILTPLMGRGPQQEVAPPDQEPMTVRVISDASGDPRATVTLVFSEPVNLSSLRRNINLRPHVNHTISRADDYSVTLMPRQTWSQAWTLTGRNYTYITIGTGYVSANGHSFDVQQELRFFVDPTPDDEIELEPIDPPPPPAVTTPAAPRPVVRYWGSGRNYVLSENENMSLYFEASNLTQRVPVAIETYRMPSIERLQQQGHIFLNYNVSLGLLERVDANVFLLDNGDNFFSLAHLGEGAYIIAVTYTDPDTGEESHHRTSYLITPLAVYMQASVRDTMVWINSARTGNPMPGLRIHFGNDEEPAAITDHNGLALFSRDIEDYTSRFRIYNANGEMVYFDNGVSQAGHGIRERYYSYLFLDRTIYRPEDTINFWGIVQPFRNNQHPMPDTVRITFDANGLDMQQEVPLGPNGVFSGTVELERIRSAQYSIQASLHFEPEDEDEDGTHVVFEVRYFSVRDFHKPAFTISSEVDRGSGFYAPGETVVVTAQVSFYDGTPLPSSMVEVSYFDPAIREWIELGQVETDRDGYATFSFPAWTGNGHVEGRLTTNWYRVRIASDGEDITHTGSYYVLPTDVLIDARMERSEDEENISLIIETFRVDFESEELQEALNAPGRFAVNNDRLLEIARGEPVDVEDLQISITWNFFDQDDEHRRHNFNSWHWEQEWNEETKRFDTQRTRRTLVSDFSHIVEANPDLPIRLIADRQSGEPMLSADTRNGSITIDGILYLHDSSVDWDRPAFSRATIRFRDTRGNHRRGWGYYPSFTNYREDWDDDEEEQIVQGLSLEARNITQGVDIPSHNGMYHFISMNVGDTVRFNVLHDSQPAPTTGRILYAIVQDGVFEHFLVTGNSFDVHYRMAHGMNVNLVAVYFDGLAVHSLTQTTLSANRDSMTLNVEVTPDREVYSPGDTVNLTVRTTDRHGNPVPASICVAVVDESVFSVSEQHIFLLQDLYHDIRHTNNWVRQYFTTHRREERSPFMDSNKTGNNNLNFTDGHRSDFRDTAAFLPATTNAAGIAHLSFTLPDNNTSWRITSVAVGNNLMGGQSRDNIISTLPFFVRPVVNTTYIEGDDIAMLVQGQGIVLDHDSEVSFTVTLTGDDFHEVIFIDGLANVSHELNFGKLPSGMYTAVFHARFGNYTDTVELPISIVRSNLELVVSRPIDLTQPLVVDASRFPVTITFFDENVQPFITSINSLIGHYCMITAQRMSRVVAKQALRDSMPDVVLPPYIADTGENIADMQNADGGIGSSIGSPSNPRITTFVLLAAQEDQFDRRAMAAYFHGVLGRSERPEPMIIAASHLGLAFLGDETMTAEFLRSQAEAATAVDVRAYYIAALAAIGETETALRLYNQHFARHVIADDAETAAIWIAATLLRHDDADDIALFFGNLNWRFHTLYEAMIYVRNFDRVVERSTLYYTVNGTQYSVEFGVPDMDRHWAQRPSRFMHTIILSRSQLENLNFTYVPEGIRATIYYIGSPSELGLDQSENLSISQEIRPIDDVTFEVTLTIELGENAPLGHYDISAWIPSNTRLYSHDTYYVVSGDNTVRFRTNQELQRLYISFDNRHREAQTIIYTYRVRQTFASEAVLDSVYMIHGYTGENANSGRGTFSTVRE